MLRDAFANTFEFAYRAAGSKDFVDKRMAHTPEEPLAFDPALD